LSRGFGNLEGVAEVRSLTQPLGTPMPGFATPAGPGQVGNILGHGQGGLVAVLAQARPKAREHHVTALPAATPGDGTVTPKRHVTRLDGVLKSDPFDPASVSTLRLIKTWLRTELPRTTMLQGDIESEVYGVTVNAQDLAEVTEGDRTRVNVLVLSG